VETHCCFHETQVSNKYKHSHFFSPNKNASLHKHQSEKLRLSTIHILFLAMRLAIWCSMHMAALVGIHQN